MTPPTSSLRPAAGPTRRRGQALDDAVRAAIRDELREHGYPNLTFEGVAKRAHTSKTVVYRRYPTRAHMCIDAWLLHQATELPIQTTGHLRSDLLRVGQAASTYLQSLGIGTLRSLLAEIEPDLLDQLLHPAAAPAFQALTRIIDAAIERGEIQPGPLPGRVTELPIILIRNELLMNGPPDEATLIDIIDNVCLPLLTQHRQPTNP